MGGIAYYNIAIKIVKIVHKITPTNNPTTLASEPTKT
jgi:hypothetical protein